MALLREYSLLVIVILLGFSLRAHDLEAVPLRGDEAFSVLYWADLPLQESLSVIAALDPHPPLAFALFRFWRQLVDGIDSSFALRYLVVLGNIIGAPAMFALGWRLSRKPHVGILSALMWALHPLEIWHSQDFRNYAIWAGLSVTALWLGIRLFDHKRRVDWYAYGIVSLMAALVFYAELLILLALSTFAIFSCRNESSFLRRFLGLNSMVAGITVIFFIIASASEIVSGRYSGNLQAFAVQDYLTRFVPALVLGETMPLASPGLSALMTGVLALAMFVLFRVSTRNFYFVAALVILPLLSLGLIASFRNVFHPRYVLAVVPGVILLLALGGDITASYLQRYAKFGQAALSLLLLLPWFALAILTLDAHFNDPAFRKAPAWDELGAFLNSRAAADELVIQLAVDPAFGYYYNGAAQDIGLPIKPYQDADEIKSALAKYSAEFASIYVVAREQAGWPNAGVVDEWMRQNMQEVLSTDAAGLPIRQYMSWDAPADIGDELARFDEAVALLAPENCPMLLPTGEFVLRLYWMPLSRTAGSLKTFVHAYGEFNAATGSALWTQVDQFPQEGRLDSTTWAIGVAFRDVYYMPAQDLARGRYEVHVGWYDPVSGKRLELPDGSDSFALCSVEIGGAN